VRPRGEHLVCDNPVMACEEKHRLGSEYEMATKKFSKAVSELQQKMGICPGASSIRPLAVGVKKNLLAEWPAEYNWICPVLPSVGRF
jgi:hypothetical protein